MTADLTGSNADITSNLERVDTTGQGYIADSTMSESSGIFTFPSTGIYLVTFIKIRLYWLQAILDLKVLG